MLGKLLKYEVKSTARFFLPVFVAILFLSLINKIFFTFFETSNVLAIPKILTVVLYILIIVASFVIVFIVSIQRFYKNILGQEGYLMNTLPVSKTYLILSKLIVTFMWNIATFVVTIASIFILIPNYSQIGKFFRDFSRICDQVKEIYDINISLIITLWVLLLLIGMIVGTLNIYASMTIGHLANKSRILASIGAYVVLTTIQSALTMIAMTIYGNIVDTDIFLENSITAFPSETIITMMTIGVVGTVVFGVANFFITKIILTKKLNLE